MSVTSEHGKRHTTQVAQIDAQIYKQTQWLMNLQKKKTRLKMLKVLVLNPLRDFYLCT